MQVPAWLNALAVLSLLFALSACLWVVLDLRRRPQHMAIMNLVWPITLLWSGPLGLWAYLSFGRAAFGRAALGRAASGHDHHEEHGEHASDGPPNWRSVAKGASHCGSGCTLGDIVAELFVLAVPLSLFGQKVFGTWVLDFCLAFAFGIVFQYFSIKPMRGLTPIQGLVAALKADTLSLLAWQVGMYGWMAVCLFALFSERTLPKSGPAFWFMMQLAMLAGFACSYPVNAWLIRRGIKEAM